MKEINHKIMERFQCYLYEEEKSDNTVEKYMRDLLAFYQWLGEKKQIEKKVVIEYKEKICEKYAPRSVNSMLSSLNAFFLFIGRHDLKVKTLKIQKQIFADSEKELTKPEYRKLLNTAQELKDDRLYYLMQTIGSTGIRISELKFVTCEAVCSGKVLIQCKGKLRIVFLPKQLCKMLKQYIKVQKIKKGPVFVTKHGNPLNRSNVWKMLKKICAIAGVSENKVFPHNFRHLFARTFYAVQKDIVRLADLLGHSNVNTTRIYTMETGVIHCRQIQKLGLLKC